jgi:hypothetical protein
MANENQPNTTKFGVINGSIDNQRELATNWGYAIFLGNVEQKALVDGAVSPPQACYLQDCGSV